MKVPRTSKGWPADLGAVTGLVVTLGGGCWLLTRLLFAAAARRLLAVHFATPERTLGEAGGIFAHNARIMLAVAGLSYYAALLRAGQVREQHPIAGYAARAIDGVLLLLACSQIALAGLLLSAYGNRQLRAFMPYGPVELAAWLIVIVLYLRARRRQIKRREAFIAVAVALGLLLLAAVLEAFAGL